MTTQMHPVDRKRLWLVSFASIVAILAVNYIVSGPAHVGEARPGAQPTTLDLGM
jgi:hypothetical protein